MATRKLANRYELQQLIAKGGVGEVWRGRDTPLDRLVAVKLQTQQQTGLSPQQYVSEAC
jgi:serine/threonine protein kinase